MIGLHGAPESKALGNTMPAVSQAQLLQCLNKVSLAQQQLNNHALSIQETLDETRSTILQLCSGLDQHPKPEEVAVTEECQLVPPTQPDIISRPADIADNEAATYDQSEERSALDNLAPNIAEDLGVRPEEVMLAYDEFCKADTDKSGRLATLEARPLLEKLLGHHIRESDLVRVSKELDVDKDGLLDFEEFLLLYCYSPAKKMQHLEDQLFANRESFSDFRMKVVGVNTNAVREYLKQEIAEMNVCLTLPRLFLIFFIFWLSVVLHQDSLRVQGVEHAFRSDVEENANFAFSGIVPFQNGRIGHKNIYDVSTFADFWSWMTIGLVPLFFPESLDMSEARENVAKFCQNPAAAMSAQGWPSNFSTLNHSGSSLSHLGQQICTNQGKEPSPPAEFDREWAYLFFNSRVAGLRLRQEQLPVVECQNLELQGKAYDTACTADNGFWILPTFRDAEGLNSALVNKTGGETKYFLAGQSRVQIQRQLRALEDQAWLSQRTGRVELLYTTYNAHLNLMTGMYIYFFINRGGHIYKFIKPVSVWLDPYPHFTYMLVDGTFAMLVLGMIAKTCHELYLACRHAGGFKKGFRAYFSRIPNYIEILTIAWSVAIMSVWVLYVRHIDDLRQHLATASTSTRGGWSDVSGQEQYFAKVDESLEWTTHVRTMLALYPLILSVSMMMAFHGQPRLALITETFRHAGTSLIHFAVVLGFAILAFSAVAHIWFGQEVTGFETWYFSFITVFRALVGDMDYDALVRTGRPIAITWYVGFTVVVQLIMLNMILAIVMDTYSEVKNAVPADAETFWSQSAEIFRRWYASRKGIRITLDRVLNDLDSVKLEVLTVSKMLANVTGLEINQATRILRKSLGRDALFKMRVGETQEVSDLLRRTDLRTQILVAHHNQRFASPDGGSALTQVQDAVAGQALLRAKSAPVLEQAGSIHELQRMRTGGSSWHPASSFEEPSRLARL